MIEEYTPVPSIEAVMLAWYILGWPYFRVMEWVESRNGAPQIAQEPVNLTD